MVLIILLKQNNSQFISNLDLSFLKISQKVEKKENNFQFKALNSIKVMAICDYLYDIVERTYFFKLNIEFNFSSKIGLYSTII